MSGVFMGALRPGDRRAVLMGAAALVIMLGYARVAKPAFESLALDSQVLTEQQELLAREQALLAVAPRLPAARRDVDRILDGARTRVLAGDSVAATAALASYAADVATATGVHLTAVEGRPPTVERGVMRVLIEVRGEASWRQVLTFVRLLESSPQLVDVASVRVERGPRGGPLGGDSETFIATLAGYGRGAP